MKKMILLLGVLLVTVVVLSACGGQATQAPIIEQPTEVLAIEQPTEPAMPELIGDALHGGLLYDNWIKVLGVDVPEGDQPLWATQATNTRSGKDTWRCKECHGWDYKGIDGAYSGGSHMTGFAGVYQIAGQDPYEILASLKGVNNSDHDFSTVMDEQALIDLALFLSEYQFDSASVVDGDKMAIGGDVANGQVIYEGKCIVCHGPDGLAVNFGDDENPEYITTVAQGNPWEFIHKARFGQPGVDLMPSLIAAGMDDAMYVDLLAYIQTLPISAPVDLGGRLYDNWISTLGLDVPEGDQPLWATQTTNTRTGKDTWRCKECHGWDYLGFEGRYSSGSHSTGFPGIFADRDKSTEELMAALKGENHDFSAFLNDDQMSVLVAFMQQTQDMAPYINADKTVNGDAVNGKVLYGAVCEACHGADGKLIDFDEAEYVGTLANDNPWEIFHKISYGQPGTSMPPGVSLGWSWQDIVDVLTYIQSLPIE